MTFKSSYKQQKQRQETLQKQKQEILAHFKILKQKAKLLRRENNFLLDMMMKPNQ
jgi:hypothetical protein